AAPAGLAARGADPARRQAARAVALGARHLPARARPRSAPEGARQLPRDRPRRSAEPDLADEARIRRRPVAGGGMIGACGLAACARDRRTCFLLLPRPTSRRRW